MPKNEQEEAIDEDIEQLDESDDSIDWKAEHKKLIEKAIKNRERTKALRVEAKELREKLEKASQAQPPKKDGQKSDEAIMNRLEIMALKMAGVSGEDEVELYEKWKQDTGREADTILDNKIFQAELTDLRTARANAAATTNIKGDGAASGEKGTPDYWIAKATKDASGELMFPEELPNDYKLRSAIVQKLAETSKEGKRFYNST